jgi:hypothetical protein
VFASIDTSAAGQGYCLSFSTYLEDMAGKGRLFLAAMQRGSDLYSTNSEGSDPTVDVGAIAETRPHRSRYPFALLTNDRKPIDRV